MLGEFCCNDMELSTMLGVLGVGGGVLLVQWYEGVYHVRGVWYNGREVCTMLGEFSYNGMDVRTMLGKLCYIGTMGRMFVPF